jgi:hypothetical protein
MTAESATKARTPKPKDAEWVPIGKIKPAEYNPRKMRPGPFAKLKRSIQEFGIVDPLIVNRRNDRIVGGHQRFRALGELGFDKVLVRWVDLDEDAEKALNVALNNQELQGEWDSGKLAEVLDSIKTDTVAILSGFDKGQIAGIIERASQSVEAPTYPLAARMLEHYDYAVIFCTNDTDWLYLQQLLGLEVEQSYKKQKIGIGHVIPFERFLEVWKAREGTETIQPRKAVEGD